MLELIVLPLLQQYGITGLLCLGLGYVIYQLKNELKEVNEKRLEEIKDHSDKIMQILISTNATIDKLTDRIERKLNG